MGLTFRGLDLLSGLGSRRVGIRIQIVRGFLMPAEVRGDDYIVAAARGQLAGDRVETLWRVGLAGTVIGDSALEWQTHRRALIEVLKEGIGIAPGDLIADDGYLGLSPGETARFTCRVENVVEGPVQAKRLQTFSIALVSVEPGPGWTVTEGD